MRNSSIPPGIILINKPRGLTSFKVVSQVRKALGEKVGHAGTLDPSAEGLLILLVGKATKRQEEFMNLKKEYITEAVFGLKSPTYDLEGEVVFGNSEGLGKVLLEIDKKKIKQLLQKYKGEFVQTVPPFSAVKIKGKPLYKLARKGKRIERLPKKKVVLYEAEILDFSPLKKNVKPDRISVREAIKVFPRVKIRLVVSKGFYVRSFVSELGEDFGSGALVKRLIRTRIGDYTLQQAFTPEEFLASVDRSRH